MNDETLTIGTHGSEHSDAGPSPSVLALSVVWHPDISRVGQVSALLRAEVAITRDEPLFETPGEFQQGRGLADHFLSRKDEVLSIRRLEDGGVQLRSGGHSVVVNGQPLEGRTTVPLTALDEGVIITVRERIVLCLHFLRWPPGITHVPGMLGHSDIIESLRQDIVQAARVDVRVLLNGPTGSGKEVAAKAIAATSDRANKPFISVSMAAIPPSTAIAALFGHTRGAFSGASHESAGYFGAADGGTIFLDEIGLMPPDVQFALLRVLDFGEIQPLGQTRPRKVDVRIIGATDADLEAAVSRGTFHGPLLHRFRPYRIPLPPLHVRREDIGTLFLHLVRKHLAAMGDPGRLAFDPSSRTTWIPASFAAELALGRWPGNVRQLDNVASTFVIDNREQKTGTKLEKALREVWALPVMTEPPSPNEHRAGGEFPVVYPAGLTADLVYQELERHGWEVRAAAKALNVSPNTLTKLRRRDSRLCDPASLTREQLLGAHAQCGGNLEMMARQLRVSLRALQLQLARMLPYRSK